jgi:predicted glycosyltransferase
MLRGYSRGVTAQRLKVWIDIDNPPQVQYLLPFVDAFRSRRASVLLTARDYGNTLDLLEQRSATVDQVGKEFGRSKIAKVVGMLRRTRALTSLIDKDAKPDVLLCSSRSAALAARLMGIPSFVIADYEYANSSVFRLTHSTILYPAVVDPTPFLASGMGADRLIPFQGLKEDISLAGLDVAGTPPHHFPQIDDDALVRVLFRPPAELSHYFDPRSRDLALHALEYLASREEAVVVFSPRHSWQHLDLERFDWKNKPIVLERAVPFVSLLKAADVLVCSGGTMLREAAYLGLPAYSIFKSPIGGVDRYLASIGRVGLIDSADELSNIELRKARPMSPLPGNPRLLDELVEFLLDHAQESVARTSKNRETTGNRDVEPKNL